MSRFSSIPVLKSCMLFSCKLRFWPISVQSRFVSSTAKRQSIDTRYSFLEKSGILKRINKSTVDQLVKLNFNFTEAEELKRFRKENGPFRKLEDLLNVPQLCEEKVDEVCSKLQRTVLDNQANINKIISPRFPDVNEPILNVIGIMIGVDCSITWADLSSEYKLNNWGQVTMISEKTKISSHEIYDVVVQTCDQIPESRVYVFETLPSLMPQQAYIQTFIERKEAMAMLMALLNSRHRGDNRVFFMRSKFPTKLFNIKVGNERISSRPLVKQLLQGDKVGRENNCHLTGLNQELVDMFDKLNGLEQEAYSNALLIAMTFLKLVPLSVNSASS